MTHDGYCHYDPWWILPLWPMIHYVVSDHDGYYQILWVMTRDSLSSASRQWWILPFPKDYDPWFFMLFRTRDGYYFSRIMTRDSFLSFPRLWWILPCICNIVFLCVLNSYRQNFHQNKFGVFARIQKKFFFRGILFYMRWRILKGIFLVYWERSWTIF
jgi:hypothetical protein